MERETYTIDAADKSLGRLATEVALLLRGKNKATFLRHQDAGAFVVVTNIEKMRITGKKREQKIYYRHSGYLGGLSEKVLGKELKKNPEEVLRKAVTGMLPATRLRKDQIKRLSVKQ